MLKRFSWKQRILTFAALALPAFLLSAVSNNVRQNTVGFLPAALKRASILGSPSGTFNVRRAADASIAFSGSLPGAITNTDTSESMRIADFSAMTELGTFYLDVPGVGQGPNFKVASDVYNDPFWVELAGFSIRRCNQAASFTWKGQTFSHAACHLNDGYQDYIGGGHVVKGGRKGWHDAGDFGKYTVNLAFAAAQMLQAWEWHGAVLSNYVLPIPESGNGTPDYLNEMRYGLEWLLTMQAANGTVYHKLTATSFEGFVMPEADASQRFFVPYSSSATADFCAVMSMAARIYNGYDPAFAAQCQSAATAAWNWLAANPGEVLPNDAGFGTGTYKETGTDGDHRVWAAAEYWQSTGNAAALSDFESRMAVDADKVSTFWDWGEHAYSKRGPKNQGIFTYLLSARSGRDPVRVSDLQNDLMAKANAIVATGNAHGYGRPLGTQYHWGSNGTVARQAMLLDCANQLSPTQAYVDTALDAISYIYGRNTYARSFVAGVGNNPPMNPHDRLSASDGIVNPVPGHLAGGPESTASSWTDVQGDYVTNEVAINWDAALVAALAWFVTVPPAPTPTPTPSPSPCFSLVAMRRVNAGGSTVTTSGKTWSADQAYVVGGWGYTGGSISTNSNTIAGTSDGVLYNTGRYGMSQYQFTVANGNYKVEMHFAETYFSTTGARVMSVTLQGQPAVSNLDIYGSVGGSTALVLTGSVMVSNGILALGFSSTADQPEIRAIAIYPSIACAATPTFSPSPNWTVTPTRSPTRTNTPPSTVTSTLTLSATASPTPTVSSTMSNTSTFSSTLTGSFTMTMTGTMTPSATATPSPSITQSGTKTQSSTVTASSPATPPATASPTMTPSFSSSPSASPSPSSSRTISPGASPTQTPSNTGTTSSTPTSTSSPSPSLSLTPSNSVTVTATTTPYATLSSSQTASATPTPNQSVGTGTSPTVTLTSTTTSTLSSTSTCTATTVSTSLVSPAPSATATQTPMPFVSSPGVGGQPRVVTALPLPQPQGAGPIRMACFIDGGPANQIELSLFSRAYQCLGVFKIEGHFNLGWNYPVIFVVPTLPNGTYFIRIRAAAGGSWSKLNPPSTLVVIR